MVHSQGSAGKSFVYFSGCQRPENRLKKLQDFCKWNQPTHQIEWKIHETKCLRNWNQNMVNIETVIGALPKILIAWSLPQRIQKRFSYLELLSVLPQLQRKWFWNLTVSSVIKRGKRRSKRKVFGQLKPLQCLNVKAGRLLKNAESKREVLTEDPRFWFICMWNKFSQQLSQAVSEKPHSVKPL